MLNHAKMDLDKLTYLIHFHLNFILLIRLQGMKSRAILFDTGETSRSARVSKSTQLRLLCRHIEASRRRRRALATRSEGFLPLRAEYRSIAELKGCLWRHCRVVTVMPRSRAGAEQGTDMNFVLIKLKILINS